jgi:aquaporin Z
MEGAEIGGLMLSICFFGALFYSSKSPLLDLSLSRATSSALMGAAIALTTFLIIRSPFGRRSGAHFNPAITLSFLLLGRMRRWDAMCYVAAHFVGGAVGVLIAQQCFGAQLSETSVRYLVTVPGSYGEGTAFLAELILSGLLMSVVLFASNHRLLTRLSPVFVASLTIFYYAACPSISGFSVNPARTFASAVFAWIWQGIWIYFTAPCVGMLVAAGIYVAAMGRERVYCAKVFHDVRSPCPFPCHFDRLYQEV